MSISKKFCADEIIALCDFQLSALKYKEKRNILQFMLFSLLFCLIAYCRIIRKTITQNVPPDPYETVLTKPFRKNFAEGPEKLLQIFV